jgi:putative NADH-flavin reductase
MNIALFGATGRTGRRVLERCLARGDRVRALASDAGKLSARPALELVAGDARDRTAVARTMAGADAAICCLGLRDITAPTTELSDSVRTIVDSARDAGVRRIVAIASAGVLPDARGGLRNEHGVPAWLRNVAAEHTRNLRTLEQSGLDWTLMCPIDLVDDIPVGHARYAFDDLPGGSGQTGYEDLAETMVTLLGDIRSYRRRVGIVSLRA